MNSEKILNKLLMALQQNGYNISSQCFNVFKRTEELCERMKISLFYCDLLVSLLIESKKISSSIDKYGGNSSKSIDFLLQMFDEERKLEIRQGYYGNNEYYSSEGKGERYRILNECFKIMRDRKIATLDDEILLLAIMNLHDNESPPFENYLWTDPRLHTGYNTLSHIFGLRYEGLWVKHELLKWEFTEGDSKRYHLVISFAGEDREIAREITSGLTKRGYTVFYDEYEKASLWGKDLYSHLSEIYRDKGNYCLMIISKNFALKLWTRHERIAAQARAFQESKEYILPLKVDDTKIPGILDTVGYLDLRENSIDEIVNSLATKLKGSDVSLI